VPGKNHKEEELHSVIFGNALMKCFESQCRHQFDIVCLDAMKDIMKSINNLQSLSDILKAIEKIYSHNKEATSHTSASGLSSNTSNMASLHGQGSAHGTGSAHGKGSSHGNSSHGAYMGSASQAQYGKSTY
jgi:hypothetical protein